MNRETKVFSEHEGIFYQKVRVSFNTADAFSGTAQRTNVNRRVHVLLDKPRAKRANLNYIIHALLDELRTTPRATVNYRTPALLDKPRTTQRTNLCYIIHVLLNEPRATTSCVQLWKRHHHFFQNAFEIL